MSYADNLALIVAGRQQCFTKAQCCLDAITAECCRLGLKVSPEKSKAISLALRYEEESLIIQNFMLDCARRFQYVVV